MWRRLYLLLIPLRLYFALSSSYIHPDEHFQGPEIIAGEVLGWPFHRTWEFTSDHPVRSIFPLWLVYGLPLTLLKWIWEGLGYGEVTPAIAFYTLRVLMFLLSFVLEDWALDELIPQHVHRRMAIFLVSSSYVTWTFQTHTFSNSIETLIVLWSIVLIRRLDNNKNRTQTTTCIILACLGVLGIFNRITFPAFLTISLVQLVPKLLAKPKRAFILASTASIVTLYAIALDSEFYAKGTFRLRDLQQHFVFTPWNNLAYNLQTANLAEHGLHPFWQHSVANLPQLIGPAVILCIISARRDSLYWSAIIGIAILSMFQHQEPRFLLPAVPLLLSSIRLPRTGVSLWLGSWLLFNIIAGVLFGKYHQGGVVPAQIWLADHWDASHILWWKTYSPPRWLLNGHNEMVNTTDLMGMDSASMLEELKALATCSGLESRLLVAPDSAVILDQFTEMPEPRVDRIWLKRIWHHPDHIGLDDLDFGDDGIWPTLSRVLGRRGLSIYTILENCNYGLVDDGHRVDRYANLASETEAAR